jgi:hypothetical protein
VSFTLHWTRGDHPLLRPFPVRLWSSPTDMQLRKQPLTCGLKSSATAAGERVVLTDIAFSVTLRSPDGQNAAQCFCYDEFGHDAPPDTVRCGKWPGSVSAGSGCALAR